MSKLTEVRDYLPYWDETSLGLLSLLLILCLAQLAMAQGAGTSVAPDHLWGLKQAITEAAAPALSSAEETQLNALIAAFRAAQGQPDNNAALMAAHTALDNAILVGDTAGIQTQSATIANLMATQIQARLQAEAAFKVQVLAMLNAGGQTTPLTQKFTAPGLLRILNSLTFGGGPRGGFGGGPGGGFGGGRMGPPNGKGVMRPPFAVNK